MRLKFLIPAVLVAGSTVRAGTPDCAIRDIRKFAEDFATAYANRSVPDLDAKYCPGTSIELVVEDSDCDDCGPDQSHHFKNKTFKELATSLSGLVHGDIPKPGTWPLASCQAGRCIFGGNDSHLIHFHRFLKEIRYRKRNNRYYITRIFFMDGM